MEEMMMVMMKIRSHEQTSPNTHNTNLNIPITTTSTSPTWKLYENPFYTTHHHHHKPHDQLQDHSSATTDHQTKQQQQIIHRLQLPIPARMINASFFDLTFVKPPMMEQSELEKVRSQVNELKSELECERKARKKIESLNKRLVREVSEERKGREAIERVCEELAKEISAHKSEFCRMKKEMEEERKMLRTAEVIREERVQMKLADAKFLLEEKFEELEIAKSSSSKKEANFICSDHQTSFGQRLRSVLNGEKLLPVSVKSNNNVGSRVHSTTTMAAMSSQMTRKGSGSIAEAENPHIRRGIRGFVEFPRVVRAIGCRSGKHLGSKLECQKAQLKILLKQKGSSVRFNGLIAS